MRTRDWLWGKIEPAALLCAVAAAGCAGGEQPPGNTTPRVGVYELKTPVLVHVSPTKLALGDPVQVAGEEFIDPMHGSLRLHMRGSFVASTGQRNEYEGDAILNYKNKGMADFEFGPNVMFTPTGDRLGSFTGEAIIISRLDATGEEKASTPKDISVQVLPSLMLEQLTAVGGNCKGLIKETLGGTDLAIGLRALGMDAASEDSPVVFRFSYSVPGMATQFVRNVTYDHWPVPTMPDFTGSPKSGVVNSFEITITSGSSVFVEPHSREQVVRANPPVHIGQSDESMVKLAQLQPIEPAGFGSAKQTIRVEAVKSNGQTLKRDINLEVFNEGEIKPWNGGDSEQEFYPPTLVCGCSPGNDIGRDLTYTENMSESRSRQLNYEWNINTSNSTEVNFGSWGQAYFNVFGARLNTQVSQTFGVSAAETVMSEQSQGRNLTAHILPTYFGACYRQAVRTVHKADIVYHNRCGVSANAGQVSLTDWFFGFDIATGPTCPPRSVLTDQVGKRVF